MHLVSVDFADDSSSAIKYAFRETDAITAAHILTGIDRELWQVLVEPPAEIGQRVLDNAANELREFVDQYKPPGATVRTITSFGSPYKELLELASRESAEIVWCGRSSKPGIIHAAIGSTVFRLASQLEVPIGVIGKVVPDTVDTIIVPFDLSKAGESALLFASKRAERLGATVRVVHAINHTIPAYHDSKLLGMPTDEDLIDARETLITVRRGRIKNILDRLEIEGATMEFAYTTPAEAVVDILKRYPNSEVVMAQRCRDLKRLVLGSVTERVLKSVEVPVFVVPAHQS